MGAGEDAGRFTWLFSTELADSPVFQKPKYPSTAMISSLVGVKLSIFLRHCPDGGDDDEIQNKTWHTIGFWIVKYISHNSIGIDENEIRVWEAFL